MSLTRDFPRETIIYPLRATRVAVFICTRAFRPFDGLAVSPDDLVTADDEFRETPYRYTSGNDCRLPDYK
jgi:hypothetical protein